MKFRKIICLLCVSILFFSSGCSYPDDVDKKNIITVFSAESENGTNIYTFMTTVSTTNGKKKSDLPGFRINSYKCYDFENAVKMYENNFGKAEFGHLTVIIMNEEYLEKQLKKDLIAVKSKCNVYTLTKSFIVLNNSKEIIASIGETYDGSGEKFVKNCFRNERKYNLCTMSELILSLNNKYYTASIPVLSLSFDEEKLPVLSGAMLFSQNSGTLLLNDSRFEMYCDYAKVCKKSSACLEVRIEGGKICVTINSDSPVKKNILQLAYECKNMGFDLLNGVYYSKKCFWTYAEYEKCMDMLYISDMCFR